MTFKEELQKLSVQVLERKKHITNEEMTKQALIIPFLQVLGYDVFSPLEVKSEYIADFGKKKGEKVDYAIFKGDKPIIFIEAKPINEILDLHDAQLARYFNATPEVKLAVITNGSIYKFFTDLNSNNIMDETPFVIIDITDLYPGDVEILDKFRKEVFETDSIVKYAEELIYTSNLNTKLKELFKNPPDDFIRYLIKDFSDTRITSNVIERFRPIVRKSISNALLDIVSQGLLQAATSIESQEIIQEESFKDISDIDHKIKKDITTTDDELKCFEIIKQVLTKAGKDISEVKYKDTASYFAVFNRNINYWFIRVKLEGPNKIVSTRIMTEKAAQLVNGLKIETAPKGAGESRIYISCPEDLNKLDKLIIECFNDINE